MQLEFQWSPDINKQQIKLNDIRNIRAALYQLNTHDASHLVCNLNDVESKIIQCMMAACGRSKSEANPFVNCIQLQSTQALQQKYLELFQQNNAIGNRKLIAQMKQWMMPNGVMTDYRIMVALYELQPITHMISKIYREIPTINTNNARDYIIYFVDSFRDFMVIQATPGNAGQVVQTLQKYTMADQNQHVDLRSLWYSCNFTNVRHKTTLYQMAKSVEVPISSFTVLELMQLFSNEWVFNPFNLSASDAQCINPDYMMIPYNNVDVVQEKALQMITLYRRDIFNACYFKQQGDIQKVNYIDIVSDEGLYGMRKWYLQQNVANAEIQKQVQFSLSKGILTISKHSQCDRDILCSDEVKAAKYGVILGDLNYANISSLFKQKGSLIQQNTAIRQIQHQNIPQWQNNPILYIVKNYGMSRYTAAVCMLLRFQQVSKKAAELSWNVYQWAINDGSDYRICRRQNKTYDLQPNISQIGDPGLIIYKINGGEDNGSILKILGERLVRFVKLEHQYEFYQSFNTKEMIQSVEISSYYKFKLSSWCNKCQFSSHISASVPLGVSAQQLTKSKLANCLVCQQQNKIHEYVCAMPKYGIAQIGTTANASGIAQIYDCSYNLQYDHKQNIRQEEHMYEYLACQVIVGAGNVVVVQKIGVNVLIQDSNMCEFIENHPCYNKSLMGLMQILNSQSTVKSSNKAFLNVVHMISDYYKVNPQNDKIYWVSGQLRKVQGSLPMINCAKLIIDSNKTLQKNHLSLKMIQLCGPCSIQFEYYHQQTSCNCIVNFDEQTVVCANQDTQDHLSAVLFNKDSKQNMQQLTMSSSQFDESVAPNGGQYQNILEYLKNTDSNQPIQKPQELIQSQYFIPSINGQPNIHKGDINIHTTSSASSKSTNSLQQNSISNISTVQQQQDDLNSNSDVQSYINSLSSSNNSELNVDSTQQGIVMPRNLIPNEFNFGMPNLNEYTDSEYMISSNDQPKIQPSKYFKVVYNNDDEWTDQPFSDGDIVEPNKFDDEFGGDRAFDDASIIGRIG